MEDSENDIKEYIGKAASYCSLKERCISQVKEKLISWDVPIDLHDNIIEYLLEKKYIDESRYANSFANDKFKFNKWGKQKIRMHLSHKQISNRLIEESLNRIDMDEYLSILKDVIEKKQLKTKDNDPYNKKAKIIRHAISKGFEMNLIMDILN